MDISFGQFFVSVSTKEHLIANSSPKFKLAKFTSLKPFKHLSNSLRRVALVSSNMWLGLSTESLLLLKALRVL
jgi:hypothetical protein